MTSHAARPSSRSSARLRDEQIAALVWHEIEGTSRFVARARVVAMTVIVLFLAAILTWQPPPWSLW